MAQKIRVLKKKTLLEIIAEYSCMILFFDFILFSEGGHLNVVVNVFDQALLVANYQP